MAKLFRVAGHPVYPILFSFSIALFVAGVICDIASLVEKTRTPYWTLSYYAIGGGVAAGLLAAIPGFIDFLSLNHPEVRRLYLWHLLTGWAALVLFIIDFYLRRPSGRAAAGGSAAMVLIGATAGLVLILVSGWLRAETVYQHGVGVRKTAAADD